MTRVLSGIQPTGDIHLGNYLGAIRQWVVDQHEHDSLYPVVDLHALTIYEPGRDLAGKSLETATVLVAAGLDPDVCTLFLQSHVPEHPQLAWLLECTASMGELGRMTQFKDKSAKGESDSSSVGLFTYPVLQASDILLYDADRVPVGEDQRQHLELCRDLAQRFNFRYGDTFVIPAAGVPTVGARVADLQEPTRKMSKSATSPLGTVLVLDAPERIRKKIRSAVTDSSGGVAFDPEKQPGVSNLLSILAAVTGRSPGDLAAEYSQYGPLKNDTADAVISLLAPLQTRYAELAGDPGEMTRVLRAGAEKARTIASATLQRAQHAIGLFGF
jgi:tryptophanyl-tRNA synthetase